MHISGQFSDYAKANIETPKANIENKSESMESDVLSKTKGHIVRLYNEYGSDKIFGRSMVEQVTGLKAAKASELIKMLSDNNMIEPVQDHGKGKYRFK